MALSKEQQLGEIVALRIKTKTNRSLRSDLASGILAAFKKHGIAVDGAMVDEIIIALPDEVGDQLINVVLPGGTNCGAGT